MQLIETQGRRYGSVVRRIPWLALALACAQVPVEAERPSVQTVVYGGTCDASAGVSLGGGRFLVGSDEDNRLRIYRTAEGGAEIGSSGDLSQRLDAVPHKGGYRELDIEGAARLGDRIFWIGSHGRGGKQGNVRPTRRRLFAVRVHETDGEVRVELETGYYASLVDDLLTAHEEDPERWPGFDPADALGRGPREPGGLNIEGLAATRDGRGLWLGFRNPLDEAGRALLLRVDNPVALLSGDDSAKFGEFRALDLDRRGIRSIAFVPELDRYYLVAGPASERGVGSALYRWSGLPGDHAELERNLDDLARSFVAEALFYDGDTEALQLLSDDGTLEVRGGGEARPCKTWGDRPELQSFRGLALPADRGP
jgi:hypothetical protein